MCGCQTPAQILETRKKGRYLSDSSIIKKSKDSARINASGLHSSLGKASGLKSSTQLSTLTRESPTVAAQNTNASAEVASILQLTRNGSTGRGGRVAACSQNN